MHGLGMARSCLGARSGRAKMLPESENVQEMGGTVVPPSTGDAYFHMHHFRSSSSTSREENAKQDHAWKHLFLVPLFEFHDTRHFVEFVLNFKVPYSKGFLKWGSRASCSMPVNSTTPTQLKEGPTKLKEAKEFTIFVRKIRQLAL